MLQSVAFSMVSSLRGQSKRREREDVTRAGGGSRRTGTKKGEGGIFSSSSPALALALPSRIASSSPCFLAKSKRPCALQYDRLAIGNIQVI